MTHSLPDPITNYNREVDRSRYRQREEYIIAHHPGFNLDYWRRIIRASARVNRLAAQWKWSREQILLTKALLISRMACMFIDHVIQRMEQAGILEGTGHNPSLEWENQYRHFQVLFLKQEVITDRFEIIQTMQQLHHYTLPPMSILHFRRRHWPWLQRLRTARAAQEESIWLERRMLARNPNPRAAARHICFIAALYADIQEDLQKQQWSYAYSCFMLGRYDYIRKFPAVLAEIVGLHHMPHHPAEEPANG